MNKQEISNLSNQYLFKIEQYYGESKYQTSTPYLSLEDEKNSDGEDLNIKGEYCKILNEIIIYWKNIESKEELIRTLIHEYIHYLQSPIWMIRYYSMGYDYTTHPYELQAYKEEQNWEKIIGYEI